MSKVSFTKLGLKRGDEVNIVDFNGNIIEVKKYLPIEEKLDLVAFVLNNSADENNFANPLKMEVFMNLGILYYYTNITFTDKQKEDAPKLYDLVEENGLVDTVIAAMDELEYDTITNAVDETIKEFYKYKNSAIGVMEMITTDYKDLNFEIGEITKNLSDKNNLSLLKDIVSKLD